MAQLWPKEVCRKFKAKNRFRNSNLDFKIEPAGPGGKIPARSMSTGLSTGVSTFLSTCLSTRRVEPGGLGAPDLVFWLGLGWVLEISEI